MIEVTIKFGGKPVTLMVKDHGIPLGTDKTPAEIFEKMRSSFHMTKQRCYCETSKDYACYGGRGITVCESWRTNALQVLIDMGLRPEGYTLERRDNDGPYSPENCVWATRATQGLNTRQINLITYGGETMPISSWARRYGMHPRTLNARLNTLGYSIEEALSKPVKCGGLLPNRDYEHLRDQSWRNTKGILAYRPKLKLSQQQIEQVLVLHKTLAMNFTMLAKLHGVSLQTIANLVHRVGAYKRVEYAKAA